MSEGVDFILSGELKGVALKDTKSSEHMQIVLRFEKEAGSVEAQKILRTGTYFSERACKLEVSKIPAPHGVLYGWISTVRARSEEEKGVVLSWTLNAHVELEGLPGILSTYLPKRKDYLTITGRIPLRQMDLTEAEVVHLSREEEEDPQKAFADEVAEEMRAHGVPVVDGGEAA